MELGLDLLQTHRKLALVAIFIDFSHVFIDSTGNFLIFQVAFYYLKAVNLAFIYFRV